MKIAIKDISTKIEGVPYYNGYARAICFQFIFQTDNKIERII